MYSLIVNYLLNFLFAMIEKSLNKPNVIFILADDLGYSDIGCFGSEINTPNLDYLGNNGILMTQMYNSGARCCPSRASLLSGLHLIKQELVIWLKI